MKLLKQQRGAIDLVLVLVVLVVAAGFGGYVYYQQQQTKKAEDAAANGVTVSKHPIKPKVKAVVDPTASWTAFTSVKGYFSLKYPPGWSKQICSGDDSVL